MTREESKLVHSKYLESLMAEKRDELIHNLFEIQEGKCFICGEDIDLDIESTDVDHIEPLATGGKDNLKNFALTHSDCNRRKQNSNLNVARALERLRSIQKDVGDKTATLGDVLVALGGSLGNPKHKIEGDTFSIVFGDGRKKEYPIFNFGKALDGTKVLDSPIVVVDMVK